MPGALAVLIGLGEKGGTMYGMDSDLGFFFFSPFPLTFLVVI